LLSAYTFYVNVEYKIQAAAGPKFTLKDDEKKTIEITKDELHKYFKPPFAATGHSLQGLTRGDKIIIYDATEKWVSRRWLIAAVTRCKTLDVFFYDGDEIEKKPALRMAHFNPKASPDEIKEANKHIEQKLRGYAFQDKKAGRDPSNNITADEVRDLLTWGTVCFHCNTVLGDRWTLDRDDDNLPHSLDNVIPSCLSCNHRHLNRKLAEFDLDV